MSETAANGLQHQREQKHQEGRAISFLPHHLRQLYFEHKGWCFSGIPGKEYATYTTELMREVDHQRIKLVLENPLTPVRIVSTYDTLCAVCPHNAQSSYHDPDLRPRDLLQDVSLCEDPDPPLSLTDKYAASCFGIKHLIDKEALPAGELLKILDDNFTYYPLVRDGWRALASSFSRAKTALQSKL